MEILAQYPLIFPPLRTVMGLLCTFDDRTALFASVPGAFFVYRFHLLELIVLRAGSLETFRTTAVAQLFASRVKWQCRQRNFFCFSGSSSSVV